MFLDKKSVSAWLNSASISGGLFSMVFSCSIKNLS